MFWIFFIFILLAHIAKYAIRYCLAVIIISITIKLVIREAVIYVLAEFVR